MDGKRLDVLVVEAFRREMSRAKVRELFDRGAVLVFGRPVVKGHRARHGEEVTVEIDRDQVDAAVPTPDEPLDVRLQRNDIVVVHKPAGQPTAPLRPGETGTLANALVGHYPEMARIGRTAHEPGLVHRLDSGTSGLVLAARTPHAFEQALGALGRGELQKRYLLLCRSEGLDCAGVIDIPLGTHPRDRRKVKACERPAVQRRLHARAATTSYRVIDRVGPLAVVEASAPRALRHQLRVHFAAIGHPLVGDVLYGGDMSLLSRQALHACHLSWKGSDAWPAFSVDAEIPADLQRLLDRVRS